MVCRTVVGLTCLGLAAAGNFSKGSCTDVTPESTTCCDVDQSTNADCKKHVDWAMATGVNAHPDWYKKFGVEKGDSFANFQCAVYLIGDEKQVAVEMNGANVDLAEVCPRPCSSTVDDGCTLPAAPAPVAVKNATAFCPNGSINMINKSEDPTSCWFGSTTEYVSETCPGPVCLPLKCQKVVCKGLATWMIALIGVLVLALVAGLAYLLMPKAKAPKKKRAIKAPPAPPAPEPLPTQSASFTMLPMPRIVTTAPPVYQHVTTAPPVYQQQPMMVAQPAPTMVQTYAAPVPMMQPVQTTAMPMVQYAQYAAPAIQQPGNLFDLLDSNGDGVISRAEMAAMG